SCLVGVAFRSFRGTAPLKPWVAHLRFRGPTNLPFLSRDGSVEATVHPILEAGHVRPSVPFEGRLRWSKSWSVVASLPLARLPFLSGVCSVESPCGHRSHAGP